MVATFDVSKHFFRKMAPVARAQVVVDVPGAVVVLTLALEAAPDRFKLNCVIKQINHVDELSDYCKFISKLY